MRRCAWPKVTTSARPRPTLRALTPASGCVATGGIHAAELRAFAERILPLTRERDTYVYFKHEDEPTGALNAQQFLAEARTLQARTAAARQL